MMQNHMNDQQNRCICDCGGTRIVIDEQLLQQRQMWKQKYLCLQRQMQKDIGQMKQTIYTQCSTLMQQQFQNKQKQHTKQKNKKNSEIQLLTSKIMQLQTQIKVWTRERQIQAGKINQLQEQIKQKDRLINMLKTQSLKSQNNWNQKLQQDMTNFRKKLILNNKQMMNELQTQNQHLKHKLKDFQKKYAILIPQVERLKHLLEEKTTSLESLQAKYQKEIRQIQKQLSDNLLQRQQVEKTHSKCRAQIIRLNQAIAQLQISIKNQKKAKNQIKVEPIYIQKPIHVQKIVQKFVPVERVIKQYFDPIQIRDQALQHEYKKLKLQNDRIMKENHILQRKFQDTVKDYERIIKEYDSNTLKYKAERQNLGKKIQQLNKQLDIVYNYRQANSIQQRCNQQPETVKVYVKNDGMSQYYSTGSTVPKVITTTTTLNSPRTLRTQQRSLSRNKTLSNSQSIKKVGWK